MKNKPLKTVVLYSSSHMGSMIALNKIVTMKCFDVVSVIRVSSIELNSRGIKKASRQLQKSGPVFLLMLIFQQLVQYAAMISGFILRKNSARILSSSELANKYQFDLHNAENINSPSTIEHLQRLKPDLIISAYFPQILKTEALNIARLGILNIHPGYLPEYQGAMAYFWAARNNSRWAGVSVHWMDEGIDTGPLISRKKFKIDSKTSQDEILVKTALIGSSLIKRIGRKLQKGKQLKIIKTERGKSVYYSIPDSKHFREYWKTRSFFSFAIIFRTILGKI